MRKGLFVAVIACCIAAASTVNLGAAGAQEPLEPAVRVAELQYWTHTAPTLIEINNLLTRQFTEFRPNIRVNYNPVGNSAELVTKLLTAYAGGAGPDLYWIPSWMVHQFVDLKMVDAVNPRAFGVNTQSEVEALFEDGALAGYRIGGTLYTAGISEYNTLSLFYNKKALRESGVALPSATRALTMEQLVDIAVKLTVFEGTRRMRSGFEFLYVPIGPANWVSNICEPWVRQKGGGFVDARTGEPRFDSTEVVEVFQFLQDLVFRHRTTDPSFIVNIVDDFANERIAMFIAGMWGPPIFQRINPNLELGVTPLPYFERGKRSTILYAWSWMVNPNSPHREAAWDLASFLSTQNADVWWEKAGYIQPVKGRFQALSGEPMMETFIEDFKYGKYGFQSPKFNELTSVLGRAQSSVMASRVDVTQVLRDAQKEAQEIARR